ncbi:MAG: hypothetical protein A2Y07_06480 [Planctomycetes bacterium GWF2_50_10]|nr:MAG: hypothetical protein A2Y07_06480 [Planctomycetes bacterium GWF2_50_10]
MARFLCLCVIVVSCVMQVSADTIAYYNFEQGTIGSSMQGSVTSDNTGGIYDLSAYPTSGNYAQFGSASGPQYPYTNQISVQSGIASSSDGYLSTTASAADLTAMTQAMAGSFTIEAWIKPTREGTDLQSIASVYDFGGPLASNTLFFGLSARNPDQYALYIEMSMTGNGSSNLGGVAAFNNNTFLNYGVWHHVALTWDASTNYAQIFVDGGPQGTFDLAASWWGSLNASGNTQFTIGRSASYQYTGNIDEVRLSSDVLNADQFLLNVPEPISALSLLAGGLVLRLRRK